VVFSGDLAGYGNVVIIDHGNGFVSKYAHNSVNLVKEGDEVNTGAVIARVGSIGRSTGPHLHFELKYNGEGINPARFIARG
jgi:murein DD-endopeptidase MepM/ murein hydrolase activator NlpD